MIYRQEDEIVSDYGDAHMERNQVYKRKSALNFLFTFKNRLKSNSEHEVDKDLKQK